MGERYKTWAVVNKHGDVVKQESQLDAEAAAKRWDEAWTTDAPHRAVHLVEMSPWELAEWEAWKARPVAGSDTRGEGEAAMPPDGTWWEWRGKAHFRMNKGRLEWHCGGTAKENVVGNDHLWELCPDQPVEKLSAEEGYTEHPPAPTVKESLTVPPPLKVGDVVDGRDPAQLARIPVDAETVYTCTGRERPVRRVLGGFEQTQDTEKFRSGEPWDGNNGPHRIVSLPPGYGEAAEDENEMLDRLWDSIDKSLLTCRQIAYEFARKAITARDGAIRAEERRRCEAELERGQDRIVELENAIHNAGVACGLTARQHVGTLRMMQNRIAELERYVGGQMLRSDFRTADEMRAALDAANARLAQSGKGDGPNVVLDLEVLETARCYAMSFIRHHGREPASPRWAVENARALHAAAQEGRG